ncbi:hypothetical protein GA0115240_11102, partial [Streptomyces sp. DvalAA-14]|uniref:alkaline phosphatase PhoX n=1 Tax=unclassified Streptomyces TaxID=2593676 RepID=UPI00081AF39F
DDPAGLLALPVGFSYRVVSRGGPGGQEPGTQPVPHGDPTPWGSRLTRAAGEDGGYVAETAPDDGRTDADPRPVRALGRFAHRAVVADPRRGHLYLTEDASGPDGLLYRWTPPRDFAHGPGRLAALSGTDGALQAFRCFDSGGRFVADLSRATRIGTVYGVDWADVPDRAARQIPVRAQFTGGQVTRAPRLQGMCWAGHGPYIVSAHPREDGPVRDQGAVWFYNASRRTLTLTALLGATAQPAPGGGLVLAGEGDRGHWLYGTLGDGRSYPLARNQLNAGSAQRPEYAGFTAAAFSPDGGTLFAGIGPAGLVVAVTGPWRPPAAAAPRAAGRP